MRNITKILLAVMLSVVAVKVVKATSSIFTDLWTVNGNGPFGNTAIGWINSSRDLELYDGDIYLGAVGTTPSTTAGTSATAGGYPGLKVPFKNVSGATLVQGSLVIASSTGTGQGTVGAVTSTTTVIGVCEGTVATGSVGYMTVSGYALVLTTGAVLPGDVIVSTNPDGKSLSKGYGGSDSTPDSGAAIGRAMSVGTAAGGLTLVLLGL